MRVSMGRILVIFMVLTALLTATAAAASIEDRKQELGTRRR